MKIFLGKFRFLLAFLGLLGLASETNATAHWVKAEKIEAPTSSMHPVSRATVISGHEYLQFSNLSKFDKWQIDYVDVNKNVKASSRVKLADPDYEFGGGGGEPFDTKGARKKIRKISSLRQARRYIGCRSRLPQCEG